MANFFSTISKLFKKESDNSVVGVDVGSSSVKIVQLRNEQGRVILETYGEIALGPYKQLSIGQAVQLPSEQIADAIKTVFAESNVTTKQVALSIPLRSSLLTLIEVPEVDKDKIDQVVQFEARKYIPVPISEVILDWWVIPKHEFEEGQTSSFARPIYEQKSKMLEVLITAILKSVVANYDEIVQDAGLVSSPFELETFSGVRSIIGGDVNAVAMMDMGATSTRLVIIDMGVARSTHTINKGAQDITFALSKSLGISFAEAEEAKRRLGAIGKAEGGELFNIVNPTLEYIFFEANKILTNYQKKYSRNIGKVFLIGGGALLKGLPELATKNMGIPVEIGNPFNKVEAPAFLGPVMKEAGPIFANALGLALKRL